MPIKARYVSTAHSSAVFRRGGTVVGRSSDVIEQVKVREVAGVFHSRRALDAAVDDLLLNGFDRADIDLMADAEAVRQHLGRIYVDAKDLADVPEAPRTAFVSRDEATAGVALVAGLLSYLGATAAALSVVASGGAVALAVAAAAAGGAAGGGVGALIARFLGPKQAGELEAQMIAGGLVLWVRVRSQEQEAKAQLILLRHGGDAVRVHEIEIDKRLEDLPLSGLRPDPWLGVETLAHP
jgi:hypothetical protein